MGRLSDILNGGGDDLRQSWDSTEAAGDFSPLPSGTYVARVVAGELFASKRNATPGYKLSFRVLDGEHRGRLLWCDIWLTKAALPMAKRDLAKLGLTRLGQLERPVPPGIRCSVKVALRTGDDGRQYNEVRSFDVLGIDPPDLDPFAPADPPPTSGPTAASRDVPPPSTTSDEAAGVPF